MMKRISLKRLFLIIIMLAILSVGLTGCVDFVVPQPTPTTGTVRLVVSGNWSYNLKMDGATKFSNRPSGTYSIPNVPIGNHTFEAIDTMGASWGYDKVTEYISTGINYVYLDPVPDLKTGTVYLVVSGNWKYDLKIDGVIHFYDKPSGTYSIPNVPVGNHTFEAIDTMGASWGHDSKTRYVSEGSNYVYLYP